MFFFRSLAAVITAVLGALFIAEGAWSVYHRGWSFGGGLYGNELVWVVDRLVAQPNGNALITGLLLITLTFIVSPPAK